MNVSPIDDSKIVTASSLKPSKASTKPFKADVIPFPARYATRDSLPVVNVSGLYHPNPSVQRSTAGRIGEIAMANGFLYIEKHDVSRSLISAVYEQAQSFFNADMETKSRYYIGRSPNHRGYVPFTEKGDYADEEGPRKYEAFDMGVDHSAQDPDFLNGNPLVGPNVWPKIPGFQYILGNYLTEMQRITSVMCGAFEQILGLESGFFAQHMDRPVSQLRLLHYLENKSAQEENTVNMGAHTDYECFTILHSQTPGLQVLDSESKWVAAPPIDNTFYFNIGDMLEAWSGGLFVSTPHKVVNSSGAERFSLPYFAATNFNTVVSPVHSQKYSAKQKEYAPIVAGEHLLNNMLRDFPYLRKKYEAGLLNMGGIKPGNNPFEDRMKGTLKK